MTKHDVSDDHWEDDEDEGDAYEERVDFLVRKWGIPRDEAERLLENKRDE